MTITITDGAENQTINTGAAIDAALQRIADKHNAANGNNYTRAQILKSRIVELGQNYKSQIDSEREEAHMSKFLVASESGKVAAETAVA